MTRSVNTVLTVIVVVVAILIFGASLIQFLISIINWISIWYSLQYLSLFLYGYNEETTT